jgi:hypothetical protein
MKSWRIGPLLWWLALTPIALVLGYVGYRNLADADYGRLDALYAASQLFVFGGSIPTGGTPLSLEIARFLAPATVAYAAIATAAALLRDQAQRSLIQLLARRHVVLIGLGRANAVLASSVRQTRRRAVVVESDPTNPRVTGVRADGTYLLVGDATQKVVLRRAQIERARHVVVATGEDSRNLEVADQVRRLAETARARGLSVHVAIDDPGLWSELGRLALSSRTTPVVLEFFNPADRAAQALLSEAERISGTDALGEVWLEGRGIVAERLLIHLVRRAHAAGVRPHIRADEQTTNDVVDAVRRTVVWMDEAADFSEVAPFDGSSSSTVAYVCGGESDGRQIAEALRLARTPRVSAVFVLVTGRPTGGILDAVGLGERVHVVSSSTSHQLARLFEDSGIETMARARHEDYVAQARARGETVESNRSLAGWDELPESLKESNRRFVESIAHLVDELGGSVQPLRDLTPAQDFPPDTDSLELLARQEHERWSSALLADGWTPTTGAKDPEAKKHPLLVAWDELDEAEREKDRDAIRAVPMIFSRIGYEVVLPDEGSARDRAQ